MPRVLHLGGVVLDLVYRIEDLPPAGGERVAESFTACPGGAYHTLAAAVAHGARASYAGGHGRGPFGDIARAALAGLGVRTLLPRNDELDTGTCVVMVTADGERTFVGRPGAEGTLAAEALLARVRPVAADIVVLSGYTASAPGCHAALARWLPTLDPAAVLVFDPSPLVGSIPGALLERILARVDWPSANAREATELVGRLPATETLTTLLERCPRARGAIVRAGADGCRLRLRGAEDVHVAAHAVRALDTSGAGDVHVGTFVAHLAAGALPLEAVRLANAAAALAVTRPSGDPAPSAAAARALLDDNEAMPGLVLGDVPEAR